MSDNTAMNPPQMVERRYGALSVVEAVSSRADVALALKNLDPNLFLERQRLPNGRDCWCVCENLGQEQVPPTIYEYTDASGEPIPEPSMQIVYDLQARRARGAINTEEGHRIARRRSEEIFAKRKERELEDLIECARDMDRFVDPVTLEKRRTAPIAPGLGNAAMRRRLRQRGLIQ